MTLRKATALFVCGSKNQTTQLHAVAAELGEVDARFSPYYGDRFVEFLRTSGLIEFTIGGNRHRNACVEYLHEHGLSVDVGGTGGPYDLVVTCTDLVVPKNTRSSRLVVVQEGILDPEGLAFRLVQRSSMLPRWLAGTAATGLSGAYDRLCVASDGYRDHFVSRGAPADRVVVTGIPNFDDCARYNANSFPHRNFVLACTSDARETWKRDDRAAFIRRVLRIADGRKLIFKLHPNEDHGRARREIAALAPGAIVYGTGSAEEMIANADVVICQYSSIAFVALALGKEVHSFWTREELGRLMPVQNRSAAKNIANVCRDVLRTAGFGSRTLEGTRTSPELESAA